MHSAITAVQLLPKHTVSTFFHHASGIAAICTQLCMNTVNSSWLQMNWSNKEQQVFQEKIFNTWGHARYICVEIFI